MVPRVTIGYTDGSTCSFDAGVWPSARADGVDWIEVANGAGSTRFEGLSVYWLYREGEGYVVGGGSFGFDPALAPEVVLHPAGGMTSRAIRYAPDLRHRDVKLGWWW